MRANTFLDNRHLVRCTECGASEDLCLCVDIGQVSQERLFSPVGRMLREVRDEVRNAQAKFPDNLDMFVALVEEVGELANALLEHKRGTRTASQLYREAIQCAAMAVRVGTEGDSGFPYDPDSEIFRD